ncbi:MAG: hypothetical protein IT359_10910 [Gemmatimonadaceae bacterium]|nr:hypothetical protein [Gemmatimonadaceae bacterium]
MEADHASDGVGPLAERFRALFKTHLGHLPHAESFADGNELVVPAPDAALGELRVRDDGDELTICVGPHHWHVPVYRFQDESEERRADRVAETAVADVRRLVEGQTVIRVRRRADGSIGRTSSLDAECARELPPTADEVEYVWTGRR